jgi:hypothetical protein
MTLPFSPLLNLLLATEQGCPSSQRAQWYLTQPWCSCGLFCLPPCNSAVQCGWPPTRITATYPWDVIGGYWGGAWQQGGGCTSSGTSRIDHIGAVITVQLWSHCLLKIKCFSNTKGAPRLLLVTKSYKIEKCLVTGIVMNLVYHNTKLWQPPVK